MVCREEVLDDGLTISVMYVLKGVTVKSFDRYRAVLRPLDPITKHTAVLSSCTNDKPVLQTYAFKSEEASDSYQDFVQEYLCQVLGFEKLFFLKESTAGEGSIDFIAFDKRSRVFLIEVKRGDDIRAKFDVVFQCTKYALNVDTVILDRLEGEGSAVSSMFGFGKNDFIAWKRRVADNFEKHRVNPLIVIDYINTPLIATAYALFLRGFGGEFRILELTIQEFNDEFYLVSRKYNWSSDRWLGQGCDDVRPPKSDLKKKLLSITDERVRNEVMIGVEKWKTLWKMPVDPLIDATPYVTFQWKGGVSIGCIFYIESFTQDNWDKDIKKNSFAFAYSDYTAVHCPWMNEEFKRWFQGLKGTYMVRASPQKKAKMPPQTYYCVDASDCSSEEIGVVFLKMRYVAEQFKKCSVK